MSNKRLTLNMLMTFSLRGEKKKEKVLSFLLFCVFYPGCGRESTMRNWHTRGGRLLK